MKKIKDLIDSGEAPLHIKSLVKKPKPTYLIKTRVSKIYHTNSLQLDLFFKSPI
ncbi:hypothetical protein [Pedobacter rhizosphaerae]|uniref:hypothetical protein n=1 Tax=Pedobacter rhizosphaerae TaxID=390241 RepID=UPI000AD0F74D|nr:hypothetical protein [Pedobacter rhizosphaerae]